MTGKPLRVVLDTNIIVSALVFGGKPEKILRLAFQKDITPITSLLIQAELSEILVKKFSFSESRVRQIHRRMNKIFKTINPSIEIHALRDKEDNKVLEAAVEGRCSYIVTGDKDLLDLKNFKGIEIVTADKFLKILGKI